jgi:hypothetical protein
VRSLEVVVEVAMGLSMSGPSASAESMPSRAERTRWRGLGTNRRTRGVRGAERRDAPMDPIVVRMVMTRVPSAGESRAPASTFYSRYVSWRQYELITAHTSSTLPGIENACFQTAA